MVEPQVEASFGFLQCGRQKHKKGNAKAGSEVWGVVCPGHTSDRGRGTQARASNVWVSDIGSGFGREVPPDLTYLQHFTLHAA